jgi:hypothetical protein
MVNAATTPDHALTVLASRCEPALAHVARLAATIERLQARVRELEAALLPFARDGLSDHPGDIADLWLLQEDRPVKLFRQSPSLNGWNFDKEIIPEITVGDLRRASSARGGEG